MIGKELGKIMAIRALPNTDTMGGGEAWGLLGDSGVAGELSRAGGLGASVVLGTRSVGRPGKLWGTR